ncbi:hypothetical protein M2R47_05300 [Moraxella sp. Tifton1]|uniref:hypothetical protein n=1 Tax=Moraxella oculi TaxID=2940516 RepID=UPI002011CB6B|nr:hypothetical protein [Moraxella sp. Tifton1]MCL1623655.1 hypothetical protein [Moraxella sp. Tifton1]
MSEFIEVIDALKELNELLKQKQSPRPLKFWLLDYDVLELPLYVSYDKGEQIELASEKEKQSHNKNILYQLRPSILFGKVIDKSGIINLLTFRTASIFTESPRHYWTFDDFYSNPIFKALESNQQLQDELEQAKARIAELENQSGNKELPTRTANNASKIILAMAECLGWDLSKPFADETNGKIREILEKQGNVLSKDTVGKWLKQAYDIGK